MLKPKEKELFSYKQYKTWPEEEKWELIDGTVYNMSPAPGRSHQAILGEIFRQIANFLEGKPCRVYPAPFDVRLPEGNEADDDILTVVQPDISVICDSSKLDEAGCRGAPDWVIEILSPSTAARDLEQKFRLYEKQGVKEYWLIYPYEKVVTAYVLSEDKKYGSHHTYDAAKPAPVAILQDLKIDLHAVFKAV